MDAEVLLKSQLKLRITIEHYHWVAALNYCIHLQYRNIRNQFGFEHIPEFPLSANR